MRSLKNSAGYARREIWCQIENAQCQLSIESGGENVSQFPFFPPHARRKYRPMTRRWQCARECEVGIQLERQWHIAYGELRKLHASFVRQLCMFCVYSIPPPAHGLYITKRELSRHSRFP